MIFDRPNAALFRHENRMARKPRSWPPTSDPVPTLWERARALLDATVSTVGSAFALAYRQSFPRSERRELLIRLAPVERLVRTLLIIEAITFLLMTPEGRRMHREARACAIPGAAPPQPQRSAEAMRLQAAMTTIAAHQPRIEAIKEREHAEALADFNPVDPPDWQCRFLVLHWAPDALATRDGAPPRQPQAGPPPMRPWVCLLDDPLPPRPAPPEAGAADDSHSLTGPAHALARRMEALHRVIETPGPAIRRLAARIASIPHEYFPQPRLARTDAALWWHGRPEYYNAHALLVRAFTAIGRACPHAPPHPRPVDPG